MSYCSENILDGNVSHKDLLEFVLLLGFEKTRGFPREYTKEYEIFDDFYYFDTLDYKSHSGIELSITKKPSEPLCVSTRSTVGRSFYDLEHQNKTIKLIQKYFGGSFSTDAGKNRCQGLNFSPPSPSESGCYLAFQRFGSNLIRADLYVMVRNFGPNWEGDKSGVFSMLEVDPKLLSNNMLLPYLVAITEDFFKSTYIALLKYSTKKESLLKGARLTGEHLAKISAAKQTVEEAFAETLSFQRISQICKNFEPLDSKLDFAGVLKKPYHRRKVSLFEEIEAVVLTRHDFIHRGQLDYFLNNDKLIRYMNDLEVAVERCYRRLTDHYSWQFAKNWGRGKLKSKSGNRKTDSK